MNVVRTTLMPFILFGTEAIAYGKGGDADGINTDSLVSTSFCEGLLIICSSVKADKTELL